MTKQEIHDRLLSIKIKVLRDNHHELCDSIDNLGLTGQAAKDYYDANFEAEFDMDAVDRLEKSTIISLRKAKLGLY